MAHTRVSRLAPHSVIILTEMQRERDVSGAAAPTGVSPLAAPTPARSLLGGGERNRGNGRPRSVLVAMAVAVVAVIVVIAVVVAFPRVNTKEKEGAVLLAPIKEP